MNDLAKQLQGISDPKEADLLLSNVWKEFKDTRPHQALEMCLSNCRIQLTERILDVSASSEARAFCSGQLKTVVDISNMISAALEFDPAKAEYENELSDDSGDADPEDIVY